MIFYHHFESEAQRAQAADAINPAVKWLPHWVNALHVYQRGVADCNGGKSPLANVSYNVPHRWATINLFPDFFSDPPGEQRATIVHEIMHARLAPVTEWVFEQLLEPLKARNEELHAAMEREFRERYEAITEDLAIMLSGESQEPCPS